MIGSSAVAKAKPDGYTLLLGSVQTHAMNVAVIKNMLYDAMKGFTPIIETTRANWIFHESRHRHSHAGYLVAALRQPDTLTYASSGNGVQRIWRSQCSPATSESASRTFPIAALHRALQTRSRDN